MFVWFSDDFGRCWAPDPDPGARKIPDPLDPDPGSATLLTTLDHESAALVYREAL